MTAFLCPNGHEELAGHRFCRTCGEPVAQRCPSGHVMALTDRFCPSCGAPAVGADAPAVATPTAPDEPSPVDASSTAPAGGSPGIGRGGAESTLASLPPVPTSQTVPQPTAAEPSRSTPTPGSAEATAVFPTMGGTGQGAWPPPPPPSWSQPDNLPPPSPSSKGNRRTIVIAVVAAVVLLAGGAAAGILATRGHSSKNISTSSAAGTKPSASSPTVSPPTSQVTAPPITAALATTSTTVAPTTTVSTIPPGTASMASLASYIAQSAAVRPTVQNSINGVESCSISPFAGESVLQQAAVTRQNIINGITAVPLNGLPNGPQLITTLSRSLQDSIAADQDYINWMNDFATNGYPCRSDPTQDYQYNAGQTASQQATADKSAFIALWNPMAATYGQMTYTANAF